MVLPGWHESVLLICLSVACLGFDRVLEGKLSPPVNLTLSWKQNIPAIMASWSKPAGLDRKCKVNYTFAVYNEGCPPKQKPLVKLRTECLSKTYEIPNEYEICVGISTNPMECGNKSASEEVFKGLRPPIDLVTNFSCAYYDDKKMNCTWTVVENTLDLQLFYRVENTAGNNALRSCISYLTSGPNKKGCHLHDKDLTFNSKVLFVIRGTENSFLINKFMIDIRISALKLPKPKLTITKKGERLHFKADHSIYISQQCLNYNFVYTKCNEQSYETTTASSLQVEYDAACKYAVQAQVIYLHYCGGDHDIKSDMSAQEYYGEDGDPNSAFKVALTITPLILCCCLAAAILIFRRIKDHILPKIPEPSLFFKDMFNSTSDGLSKSLSGGKLYVPVKEVVASAVALEPKSALLPQHHGT